MSDAVEAFVAHALSAHVLPERALDACKIFILDTLGVGVAGARAPYADTVTRAVAGWGEAGARGAAHVLGTGARLPAPSAAFVNGFQIHCQEYDCVHEPAVVHPMATVFAALCAQAERVGQARGRPVSGRAFIEACAVAVDVATGLGVAATSSLKFFRPATAGVFGATLGCARLAGLDGATTKDALGYALASASGVMQAHVEGKPALPVQIAQAARAALMACDLAAEGLPGPHDVLEGPYAYFPLFEDGWDLVPVVESLGRVWRITEVSHKPYPTGRAAQGGIRLIELLNAEHGGPGVIQALELTAPPIIKRLVGRPYQPGMAVSYARLCFAYVGALACVRGGVGPADFDAASLNDPEIAALAAKITVRDDGSTNPAAFAPQSARAVLASGQVVEARIEAVYGSPVDPMSREDRLAKFAACLARGPRPPVPAALASLIARLDALEDAPDAVALFALASADPMESHT